MTETASQSPGVLWPGTRFRWQGAEHVLKAVDTTGFRKNVVLVHCADGTILRLRNFDRVEVLGEEPPRVTR